MTAPLAPDGDEAMAARLQETWTEADKRVTVWVTVLEFVAVDGQTPLLMDEVQALVGHLREWYPSGLWSCDRYAVQLQIPAPSASQAVSWALAYHRKAAHDMGMPTCPLVRFEVFTVDELRRSWDEMQIADPFVLPSPAAPALLCPEVYFATRALVAATTPEEVTTAVFGFVTAVGGRVEPDPSERDSPNISVELTVDGEPLRHAVAEAFSVAGLVLEQSLPALLVDARLAVTRLGSSMSAG